MTRVWLKNGEKGREGGGYMTQLLETLRREHGIESEETLAFIRAELVRSFKNGLMKARDGASPKGRVDERREGYTLKS